MANKGKKDTNSSQFYITLGKDLYSLDDNNVIFGQVSNGHDVIEKMVKT